MIYWPDYPELPKCVLQDGFEYSFADGRTRNEMSRGFDKTRGTSGGAPLIIPMSLFVTSHQVQRLRRFWQEETEGGNLWFLMRDQVLDGRKVIDETLSPITGELGDYLTITAWWLARFSSGTPAFSALGTDHYMAKFALDVRVL